MINNVFFIYGEGGHHAQMNRIKNNVVEDNIRVINIVDSDKIKSKINESIFVFKPLRKKSNNKKLYTLCVFLYSLVYSLCLIIKYRPSCIISTGPAICFPFFIWSKIFHIKSIYIETWSRFYTKSFTSKLVYNLVSKFYYQNKEQEKLYPKGIYSGRL